MQKKNMNLFSIIDPLDLYFKHILLCENPLGVALVEQTDWRCYPYTGSTLTACQVNLNSAQEDKIQIPLFFQSTM